MQQPLLKLEEHWKDRNGQKSPQAGDNGRWWDRLASIPAALWAVGGVVGFLALGLLGSLTVSPATPYGGNKGADTATIEAAQPTATSTNMSISTPTAIPTATANKTTLVEVENGSGAPVNVVVLWPEGVELFSQRIEAQGLFIRNVPQGSRVIVKANAGYPVRDLNTTGQDHVVTLVRP